MLNKRFSEAVTITGTQKFHKFIPIDNETIKVFELSCDSEGMEIKIVKPQYVRSKKFQMNPQIGNYVVCSYNSDKWVGFILSYDEEFEDFEIKFLHPRGINKFYYFPEIVDKCNISSENINGILQTPSLNAGTKRIQYHFPSEKLKELM